MLITSHAVIIGLYWLWCTVQFALLAPPPPLQFLLCSPPPLLDIARVTSVPMTHAVPTKCVANRAHYYPPILISGKLSNLTCRGPDLPPNAPRTATSAPDSRRHEVIDRRGAARTWSDADWRTVTDVTRDDKKVTQDGGRFCETGLRSL